MMNHINHMKIRCNKGDELNKLKRYLSGEGIKSLEFLETPKLIRDSIEFIRGEVSESNLCEFIYEGQTLEERYNALNEYINSLTSLYDCLNLGGKLEAYYFLNEEEWRSFYFLEECYIFEDWKDCGEEEEILIITICSPKVFISTLKDNYKQLDIVIQYISSPYYGDRYINNRKMYISPGRVSIKGDKDAFDYESMSYKKENVEHRFAVNLLLKEFDLKVIIQD